MSKKEDYVKYVKMAEKLLNKFGSSVPISIAINIGDDDCPYKPNDQKIVEYSTVGVIMPPVRGLYFQGTRFGYHAEWDDGMVEDKMSCMTLPIYDEKGKPVDLTKATHITLNTVDDASTERYKVYFCDVLKPAQRVIMFSFGLGRQR